MGSLLLRNFGNFRETARRTPPRGEPGVGVSPYLFSLQREVRLHAAVGEHLAEPPRLLDHWVCLSAGQRSGGRELRESTEAPQYTPAQRHTISLSRSWSAAMKLNGFTILLSRSHMIGASADLTAPLFSMDVPFCRADLT